ncbi:MAG: 2-hydroxyacid dehydrogenase [Gammaproteobacteria bacterium]|nr:2-hydroxyacid dehydrogenase [Gammaproteobacteria bacterium]
MPAALTHGVVLDLATLHPEDLDLSALRATLPHWDLHDHSSASNVVERLQDAEVVITNKFVLDAELLAQTPKLKLICVAATGTNNIDLSAASERGIAVTNVTGYATPSVVEHVFALILSLQRRLSEQHRAAHERWPNQRGFCVLDIPIQELRGKTLGIVGYGELGRAVANIGTAFGMCVLIAQRPGGDSRSNRAPLDEVLHNADVLSLHCPLTQTTRNLIGTRELALMKPTALLINTARGGIVDEPALVSALQNKQLGGAGIDVLIEEPPRHGNPLLEIQLPNLIVTPHIAWASREARQRLVNGLTENIRAYLEGEDRNRVC